MATIVKVGHLALPYSYGYAATISGVRNTLPPDTFIITQNKQAHVDDVTMLATGATHVEENGGIPSNVSADQRAVCFQADIVEAYCIQNNTTVPNLNDAQCRELAQRICESVSKANGVDKGVGFASSQMGEITPGHPNPDYHILKDSNSLLIERYIGEYQDARGRFYVGGYDGCVRFEALTTNWTSASDLTSDADVLNWLRTKGAPFGNLAFQPHTAGGVAYRGTAVYMTPLLQMYMQGNYSSAYHTAMTAFGLSLIRAGLRALADERDGNGNYYHTPQQRATLNARRAALFAWNALTAGVGAPNDITGFAVTGGVWQSETFAQNPWKTALAVDTVALLEARARMIYHWDDTTSFDTDPSVLCEDGLFGQPNNRLISGTTGPRATFGIGRMPDNEKIGFPIQPKGGVNDVLFTAGSLVTRLRKWPGLDKEVSYASFKAGNQTTFNPILDDRNHVFQSYRDVQGFGYTIVDQQRGRASVVRLNHHLMPYQKEALKVKILGQEFDLGTVYGSGTHAWGIKV